MPQTRLGSRRPAHVDNGDRATPQDKTNRTSGSDGTTGGKKRRGERVDPPKKRRRANPIELCQLNLDVLFLIAAYVHPLDLLNLARTCKSLRRLLMDRSSAFIWKEARCQLKGLPDCPNDLSEPAYANLAFHARCHGCGKYSTSILWCIRRRYCPDCRAERLCAYSDWPEVISRIILFTAEHIAADKRCTSWHDKDQVDLLMREYEHSPDKEQFLIGKLEQHRVMSQHGRQCERWQRRTASERRDKLNTCRQERFRSILERLKQLGYEREISYFGANRFGDPKKMPPKPLTNEEWGRMLPEWRKTMDEYRLQRLDALVYSPRRDLLASEYNSYRSSDIPTFELLPHASDLARFPPFRDIIKAPEDTQIGENPFTSAFAQLPTLVEEWKKQLDGAVAELIRIPPHLSSQDATSHQVVATSRISDGNKLGLACALFHTATYLLNYPEVFLVSEPHRSCDSDEDVFQPIGSIFNRFRVRFLEEAPYIIYACGLDPGVATSYDMECRNARLKCLVCRHVHNNIVMNWMDAMSHACDYHQSPMLPPLSESPRWELINDEYIDKIQNAEGTVKRKPLQYYQRCLLCQPRIGDASSHTGIIHHLSYDHKIELQEIKQGVHYTPLEIPCTAAVEMVEEEGQVIFREPEYS